MKKHRTFFVEADFPLVSAERGEVNAETVHSLSTEQLLKWPKVSPRNRPTHSRDASMGFVVMMERGWQWPDSEGLLPWKPLEGPKAAVDSQLMPFG